MKLPTAMLGYGRIQEKADNSDEVQDIQSSAPLNLVKYCCLYGLKFIISNSASR
jgi:hypothetical protein